MTSPADNFERTDSAERSGRPAREGNGERYEEFLGYFAQDRDRLYAYIRSLLPHRWDAEDVFQRCSILLWRKFEEFDRDREFLPWACGVAYYEVRNFLRVASRDRLQFDPVIVGQLAERRTESLRKNEDRLEALRDCVSQLKIADYELIRSAYGDDQSIAKLAASTGRAVQTLYNRLNILRRRLLDCIERKLAAEGGELTA